MWIIVIINNECHFNGDSSVSSSAQMELVEVSKGMRLLTVILSKGNSIELLWPNITDLCYCYKGFASYAQS